MTDEEKQEQGKRDKYAKAFLAKLDNSPDELTKFERRLGAKLQASRAQANQLIHDTNQLRDQIEQGKARLRSMELQLENAAGKTSGILETIIEIHFGSDEDMPPEPAKVDGGGEPPEESDTPETEPAPLPEPDVIDKPELASA